jgi:lipopolysaccharide export system protein LptA
MPWTIERLRLAIVALAVLLLLTIAGAFFYGRWRLRRIAQDLPARLGIQIQQSTQGFVLSKTERGRPLFTLHAARAVEFKSGGHVSLHDVEIDIYNRQDGKADTIAGSDFEFDPHSEVVESKGEAHIVLHAPETNARTGVANKAAGQLIRVTTHGLTFNQKTGVATCSGEVDFEMEATSGQAVGAEYDSKAGQLLLQSQVVLTAEMQNHPSTLNASRALYDRNESQVHLWQPRYSSQAESGMAGAATVLLRGNGSAESLDARDGVRLTSADGMAVRAPTMHVLLNEDNRPQQAHFFGGVQFTADQPPQKTSGNAREAEIDFNAEGRAKVAVFDHDVQFHQQTDTMNSRLQRTLASDHLLLHLLPSKTGNAQLQSADASGNAVFTSQSTVQGHAPQKTMLAAQTLKANFAAGNQLQQINGAGQTRLQTVAANGDIDTSTGDTLQIEFAPSQPASARKRMQPQKSSSTHSAADDNSSLAAQSIRTAVQTGHVVLQQTARGKNGDTTGSQISTATAEHASYVAANDTLMLTGNPVFRDAQLEMTANRMEVNRTTGKMISTGAVQTTLVSNGPNSGTQSQKSVGGLLDSRQPVHVIAEQATLMHDTGLAVFSGRARLWQGGDSVEAPVIELSQKLQTLTAYDNRPCTQCVTSNFLGAPNSSAQPSVFRILSERLTYSDAERKASFIHHVQVISSSGQVLADNAEIFLTPAVPPSANKRVDNHAEKEKSLFAVRNNGTQSSVERIVATGHVRLLQPGRTATGDRLVYTAADGHFILTGDEKNPPEVVDADRGTVTGQVLTFASRDQAIMVSGTSGHTTTTKTRVQKQ